MTGNNAFLESAEKIARTLASHIKEGDNDHSPLPFKVNAITGEVGKLKSNRGTGSDVGESGYTTNWTAMLRLFLELIQMDRDKDRALQKGFDKTLKWMKEYPLKTNKWGPFFEDIPGWSDTRLVHSQCLCTSHRLRYLYTRRYHCHSNSQQEWCPED